MQIMAWMDDLVLQCHSEVVCGTYVTGNRTYEGRYTKVLKVSHYVTPLVSSWSVVN